MNLSGRAVVELMNFYKLGVRDFIVICDDFTLELGTLRFRKNGSDGGHNGLKSIINLVGSSDFDRLKVGIGPLAENMPVENFVLGNFRQDEIQTLDKIIQIAAESIEEYLKKEGYYCDVSLEASFKDGSMIIDKVYVKTEKSVIVGNEANIDIIRKLVAQITGTDGGKIEVGYR